MNKLKYIISRILKMDFKNMIVIAKKVSRKSHKFVVFIFLDMIVCGFKYGAGYYDYQEFEFYLLNSKERKTYLTRTKNNMIVRTFNKKSDFSLFDDKEKFNHLFKDFLNRDYLVINNDNFLDFKDFLDKHKEIIVKPILGEGGKGVSKIYISDDTNIEVLFYELLSNNQTLIEECVKQHDDINKLYSKSVNTLRLFTFFDGENAYVLNSIFKIGNGGVTDNFSSGSMYTFLDDSGRVLVPAIDQNDSVFEMHPITNKKIVDFVVPFYKEACLLVKEASKVVPTIKYIGWDVAITNTGPVIIEGNSFPGVFQMKPSFGLSKTGLIPSYEKYMKIKL